MRKSKANIAGYLGMLLSSISFPKVMNSYWAFIQTVLAAALLIVRTILEDRFLLKRLSGYSDYALKTRRRFLGACSNRG